MCVMRNVKTPRKQKFCALVLTLIARPETNKAQVSFLVIVQLFFGGWQNKNTDEQATKRTPSYSLDSSRHLLFQ